MPAASPAADEAVLIASPVASDTPSDPTPTESPTAPPTATASATLARPTATATRTPTRVPSRTPTRAPTSTPRPPTATATAPSSPQLAPVVAGADSALNADEQAMVGMINQERVKVGLNALAVDSVFQSVARARATGMARTGYYSHYDPVTGKLAAQAMLLKLGIGVPMGENFYVNWPYSASFAQRAMQWFMGDPPHRNNILSPLWTVVGAGVIATSDQKGIAIQLFGMK